MKLYNLLRMGGVSVVSDCSAVALMCGQWLDSDYIQRQIQGDQMHLLGEALLMPI